MATGNNPCLVDMAIVPKKLHEVQNTAKLKAYVLAEFRTSFAYLLLDCPH